MKRGQPAAPDSGRETSRPRATPRRSTGPRSRRGKRISAANATIHGLSISVLRTADLADEVTLLARRIAGGNDDLLVFAAPIAEAHVELRRVRRVRSKLIDCALREAEDGTEARAWHCLARLAGLKLDQARGLRGRAGDRRLLQTYHEVVDESAPGRHARVLGELAHDLARLDRYERRALSRRKFAVRRFDAAQNDVEIEAPLRLGLFNMAAKRGVGGVRR
jgi:hypothetical protein